MNRYALQHIPDSAYCFPVSEHEMGLRLRTAKNDLTQVWVIYESKYRFGQVQKKEAMQKTLSGELFDYYTLRLNLQDTRLSYIFYLFDGENYYYFSEDGVTESYDFTHGYYNFFQYPYINRADLPKKVEWLERAAFYQIFVDRFCIGDQRKDASYVNLAWGEIPDPKSFAGGDLRGIIQKLDYIKDLGCSALYLTPIFQSVSNHKYDISDYFRIDPQFGSEEDLKDLVDQAHRRGMRVVLDAVFNHCSEDISFFQDVKEKGKASPYYNWFVIDGEYPVKEPCNYEVFADCDYMPKLDTSDSQVQDYLISVAVHYIQEYDIDGWRLDVSDEVSHDFWRRFRKEVKRAKSDAVIIGENWHYASNYLRGDQYDSIMNYAFTKCCLDYFAYDKLSAEQASNRLNELLARNTDTVNDMMLNLLDSHDTDRFLSEVNGNEEKLQAALCLLYLFPGEPCIFYGTEILTPGGYDPDCRRCMDWERADGMKDSKLFRLLRQLSQLRSRYALTAEGTRITSSADGKILELSRKGEGYEICLYINQSGLDGVSGTVSVAPGTFRLFLNGGEILC